MTRISLTTAMSGNLRALKLLSQQMDGTQERLSSGLRVNSAIDNASNFYQSRSLTNRAADLDALLDSMGQGIQTINAALEGIEAGTSFLEQMSSVATQAATYPLGDAAGATRAMRAKSTSEFEAEGYGVVTAGMSAADIEALLAATGKIVLDADINLTETIDITGSAIIDGNGHKITFTPAAEEQAAILIDGNGNSADIKNLYMDVSGKKAYGIRVANKGSLTIDNIMGITVEGLGAQRLVNGDADLMDGATNTKIIISSTAEGGIGANGLAATAANQFYAPGLAADDEDLGQGTWYLPSIGELMEMYGTDFSAASGTGTSGASAYADSDMAKINATLGSLGSEATTMSGYYWSSSEYSPNFSWILNSGNGGRNYNSKNGNGTYVRCFQLLENCFNSLSLSGDSPVAGGAAAPEIGNVMYKDTKTGDLLWDSADDYNALKTEAADNEANRYVAVGVVCDVNYDDGSVKIVNLKNLTFDNYSSAGNFDASDPYGGSVGYTYWGTSSTYGTDITGLDNINGSELTLRAQSGGTVNVKNEAFTAGGGSGDAGDGGDGGASGGDSGALSAASYQQQFNSILNEYDALVKDTSYQGINLLTGGKLNITFNESRSHQFALQGQNISSAGLGLNVADWQALTDIAESVKEIQNAIDSLRSYSAELGNNYSILQTRQNFTAALIDVLEVGSDMLVLADMNEESANYLALQTRQQLATNSLSLAAQSAQSVLSLF